MPTKHIFGKWSLATTLLTIFSIFLFIAIFVKIDGLGILSLCASIILLCILHYKFDREPTNGQPDDGNGEDIVKRNMLFTYDKLSNPRFLKQAIILLFEIIKISFKAIPDNSIENIEKFNLDINEIQQRYDLTYHKNQENNHSSSPPPKKRR